MLKHFYDFGTTYSNGMNLNASPSAPLPLETLSRKCVLGSKMLDVESMTATFRLGNNEQNFKVSKLAGNKDSLEPSASA